MTYNMYVGKMPNKIEIDVESRRRENWSQEDVKRLARLRFRTEFITSATSWPSVTTTTSPIQSIQVRPPQQCIRKTVAPAKTLTSERSKWR